MNAVTLVKALKGKWHGRYGTCRCPAHNDKDPSLSVSNGHGGALLVKCHAGCPQASVIEALRARGLWTGLTSQRRHSVPPVANSPGGTTDDRDRISAVLAIWGEARSIDGTPGLTYLGKRGIDLGQLPNSLHNVLRWHPACQWERGKHPAMVALFTDAISGAPKAIHRTAIAPSGDKVGRKVLGPASGCVIRLWPDGDVTTGLVLGEGIETTLAAATNIIHRGTHLRPAWAVGSAGGMAKFPVLAGVDALTLLVDNDTSGTGQRSADECSARWTQAGREVFRLVPSNPGVDFNDLVRTA